MSTAFIRICALALVACVAPAGSRQICDGKLGPDFFNVSFVLEHCPKNAPSMQGFRQDADVLVEFQEALLELICNAGFKVTDNCGLHYPEEQEEARSRLCSSEDLGLGYISLDYTNIRVVGLGHKSCCKDEESWQQLTDMISAFKSYASSTIDQEAWKMAAEEMEHLFGLDQAFQRDNLCTGTNPEGCDVITYACWACFTAYEILKLIAGVAKISVWRHVYEVGHALGKVEGGWTYETARGVHHSHVIHSLLKDLEAVSDLWVSLDGSAKLQFRAVEVGVYQGLSSLRWLKWQANLTMLLVDPYMQVFPSGDKYIDMLGTDPDDDLRLVRRGLAPYANRSSILVAPSVHAASLVPDNSVALVFVDGDHSSVAVAKDVRAWLPKIRPGGIIAGHDYHPCESWGREVQFIKLDKNEYCSKGRHIQTREECQLAGQQHFQSSVISHENLLGFDGWPIGCYWHDHPEGKLHWVPPTIVRPSIGHHDVWPLCKVMTFRKAFGPAGPSVPYAVQLTLPPGRKLHLSVEALWWWEVHSGDVSWLESTWPSLASVLGF